MSEKSKYKRLQELVAEYGAETVRFNQRVRELGRSIMSSYSESLGEKARVYGVPPDGDFTPRAQYRDAAFSTYYDDISFLEPATMGICTEIGNLADHGATWVRTVIEFQPNGSEMKLFVGEREQRFTIGENNEDDLAAICDAIYKDVSEAFSLELNEAQGKFRMGFLRE